MKDKAITIGDLYNYIKYEMRDGEEEHNPPEEWDECGPDELYWYLSDELGVCGCGDPEYAVAMYAWALASQSLPIEERKVRLEDLFGYELALIMLYQLDRLELTDHGTSVFSGWLTEKGKKLLNAFGKYGLDSDKICSMRKYKDYHPWTRVNKNENST